MVTKTSHILLFLSLFLLLLSNSSHVGATHRILFVQGYTPPSPTCGDQIGNQAFEEAKQKTRKRKLCRHHASSKTIVANKYASRENENSVDIMHHPKP